MPGLAKVVIGEDTVAHVVGPKQVRLSPVASLVYGEILPKVLATPIPPTPRSGGHGV